VGQEMGVIEQLIILLNPKSAKLNVGCETISKEKRLFAIEVFAALNTAGSKHCIGMHIIKAKYLQDGESVQWLSDMIDRRCQALEIPNSAVVTYIIIAMLLNKPLPTQRKLVKSLHKRFGSTAAKAHAQINRLQSTLESKSLYSGNGYAIHSLQGQIDSIKLKLDSYAEQQSLLSNRCPACAGRGCEHCTGGKITVRMVDAQALFKDIGLTYPTHLFMTMYWSKILCLVSGLELNENDALNAMKQRMENELNA
jgi:uncharacterized phage protein